jgi:subtilisin family serine protease
VKVCCGLICLMFFVAPSARALECYWRDGSRNITLANGGLCTLNVVASSTTALPDSLALVYSMEGGPPNGALELVSEMESFPGGICGVAPAVWPETGANIVRALLCADSSPSAAWRRYVFRVAAGARGKCAVTERRAQFPVPLTAISEAAINGGTTSPYPPLIGGTTLAIHNGIVVLEVQGAWLEDVQAGWLLDAAGKVITTAQVVARDSFSVALAADVLGKTPSWLEVTTTKGLSTVASLLRTAAGGRDVLVRFRRHAVRPPEGRVECATSECVYSDTQLRDSLVAIGVQTLRRVASDTTATSMASEFGGSATVEDIFTAVLPDSLYRPAVHRLGSLGMVAYVSADSAQPAVFQCPPTCDPLYPFQWGLKNVGQPLCDFLAGTDDVDINGPEAWAFTTGTAGVGVAFLDTGIDNTNWDMTYCQLAQTFVPGTFDSFDDDDIQDPHVRHGTQVASLGVALRNDVCIAGVAPGARGWAVKIFDRHGYGQPSWMGSGIDHALAIGLPILNISGGFSGDRFSPMGTESQAALNDFCLKALYRDRLVVAATGNDDDSVRIKYPAAFRSRVLGVGACDIYGDRWSDESSYRLETGYGSSYGSWTDVVAPGGRLIVAARGGMQPWDCESLQQCNPNLFTTMGFGGTSAAAPIVAGTAALLKSADGTLTGEDLAQVIVRTARDITRFPATPGRDGHTGWGLVRADDALRYIVYPRFLQHWTLGANGAAGGFSSVDSVTNVSFVIVNDPD